VGQASGAGADYLAQAWTTQSHAADLGFDWPDVSGVLAKVREEIDEVEAALSEGQSEHAKREMGDLLFSTVNLARFLQADPADELRLATERFESRFRLVKEEIRQSGRRIKDCTLDQLEDVWQRAKQS
jgi:nucleoside triphosphate diphosphatase